MERNLWRGKLTDRFKDLESLRPDLVKKGITKNGWIYGSLIADEESGRTYICIHSTCSHNTYVNNGIVTMFEVVPETVGQYIGREDIRGVEIFEGDIIKTQPFTTESYSPIFKTKQHIGTVVPHMGCDFVGWTVDIKDYDGCYHHEHSEFYMCSILGNIHDNPELLER